MTAMLSQHGGVVRPGFGVRRLVVAFGRRLVAVEPGARVIAKPLHAAWLCRRVGKVAKRRPVASLQSFGGSSNLEAPTGAGVFGRSVGFAAWTLLGALVFVLGTWRAGAFPPAPHHTLFGIIRNQWGDPIRAANGIVFLQTSNSAALKAAIVASVEPGVNYRLNIPMDSFTAPDLYLPTALRRGQPFLLKVQIGPVTYLPIEMALGPVTAGQPAESTRLDLTLGEDSDGDGLPDAWEEAIIAVYGGTLASITPGGDTDGDGISNLNEYLAGTYAFDPNDGFRLSIPYQDVQGTTLEFLAIRGRTYSIQASSNLQQWSPVDFRVITGQTVGALQSTFTATDVRQLQVFVPIQPGAETNRYFKALVQ